MPELPEVETVKRGVEPHLLGRRIRKVSLRERRLRWPVRADLPQLLAGQRVRSLARRGKYLLIYTDAGCMMVHLGMSGRLYLVKAGETVAKHDHIDWELDDGRCLRFTDPRRFGSVFYELSEELAIEQHPLLASLGPEPLGDDFDIERLWALSRKKSQAVKTFIMDSKVVVGVGNIYANEALFMAGIRPGIAAGRISRARYEKLVVAIKQVLAAAIEQGGTTLKDFVGGDGKPGYFAQELNVYGRGGQTCVRCGETLKETRMAQRATVYCPSCQS